MTNFILFLCIQTRNNVPTPVTMTGTCQSVEASFDMTISVIGKIPDRSLDR